MQLALNSQGHSLCFSKVYETHYQSVAAVVNGFRFAHATSDDLIQDTFVQAWQNIDALRDVSCVGPWIKTIARNMCLSELRKSKKNVLISLSEETVDEKDIVAENELTEQKIQFEYSYELLNEMIEGYQVEPRATIAKKFYLENKSAREISQELNTNRNTVLSHLRRFRLVIGKALIELLEEKDIEVQFSPRM